MYVDHCTGQDKLNATMRLGMYLAVYWPGSALHATDSSKWQVASKARSLGAASIFHKSADMNVDGLIRVTHSEPGGPYYVVLSGDDLPEVRIGPEANPAIARQIADELKAFLQKLLATLSECAD